MVYVNPVSLVLVLRYIIMVIDILINYVFKALVFLDKFGRDSINCDHCISCNVGIH